MSDIIFSTFFLLLSAFFFILTFGFPHLTVALSPVVFPRFVTICLFILSSILMAQGVRRRRAAVRRGVPAEKKQGWLDRPFIARFLLLAAVVLLYIGLLELLGYLIATPLCIAAAMLIFGERRWLRIVLVAALSTVVLYALFRMVFRVPLPRSFIW